MARKGAFDPLLVPGEWFDRDAPTFEQSDEFVPPPAPPAGGLTNLLRGVHRRVHSRVFGRVN